MARRIFATLLTSLVACNFHCPKKRMNEKYPFGMRCGQPVSSGISSSHECHVVVGAVQKTVGRDNDNDGRIQHHIHGGQLMVVRFRDIPFAVATTAAQQPTNRLNKWLPADNQFLRHETEKNIVIHTSIESNSKRERDIGTLSSWEPSNTRFELRCH